MRACLEFQASGGVRFGVDFAPYMVTKRFTSAARQIRVCVVFRPMGDEQTRVGAVLGKKAEPRHAVHPMGAGHGSGWAPKEKRQRRSNEGFASSLLDIACSLLECGSSLLEIASSLLECASLSGSAADCIARIRGVSSGALLRAIDHLDSGDHLVSPACEPEERANARRYPPYPELGAASVAGLSPVTPRSSRTTRGGQVHVFLGICVCVSLGPVFK